MSSTINTNPDCKSFPDYGALPKPRSGKLCCHCLIIIVTVRQRSLRQGNVFTHVCHSVYRGGGVGLCHRDPPTEPPPPQEETP